MHDFVGGSFGIEKRFVQNKQCLPDLLKLVSRRVGRG